MKQKTKVAKMCRSWIPCVFLVEMQDSTATTEKQCDGFKNKAKIGISLYIAKII